MAVRKIPLKRRPYLPENATESDSAEVWQASSGERTSEPKKSPDLAVRKTLALIRKKVLLDRALHDQVSLAARITIYDVRRWLRLGIVDIYFRLPPFTGCGGICLICQGVL